MVGAVFAVLFLVSAISFIGLVVLAWRPKKSARLISLLVPFAAGSLLGDAFVHLLPHAFEEYGHLTVSAGVVGGFFLFFVLEKVLLWHHCHNIDCEEHLSQIGALSLVADGLHNFIDGVIVAASFRHSWGLGLTTSLAVVAHEIPQEIGDFIILLHAGHTRRRALVYNFLSSLSALIGGGVVLAFQANSHWLGWLLPFTAGGFVYLAASGLIPQIQQEEKTGRLLEGMIGLGLGFGIMFLLLGLE